MARLDVLRDFAALQMLIFRAVGLANPTEQVSKSDRAGNAHIQSGRISKSDRAGVADTEQVQRKMRCRRVCQWAKVNGRNFALVEYQDLTPASAPAWCRGRCSVAVLQFKNTQDAGL